MAVVSSLVTMGMGPGPGGMVTMGMGPSMAITTMSTQTISSEASTAFSPYSSAWTTTKKKYPWMDQVEEYPSLYVVKAALVDVNGKELIYPVSKSITKGYYEKRKPRVYATFKWAKAVKASVSNIIINALRILRGKDIEDEDFYE